MCHAARAAALLTSPQGGGEIKYPEALVPVCVSLSYKFNAACKRAAASGIRARPQRESTMPGPAEIAMGMTHLDHGFIPAKALGARRRDLGGMTGFGRSASSE
ncbi:hypothetical protein MESS2_1020003 [Mesorhizobium metallidurans STM 2683]|uniref:Uncharacterized protein n=1 Tax=Mesorhizobium metallidurans STM 2683 TaxID=1297569 RepID=M5EFH1_9HYPH|nr:hypothetical protein MESS2_1020003 [Mesorhizobium metallidurans STM 2683]